MLVRNVFRAAVVSLLCWAFLLQGDRSKCLCAWNNKQQNWFAVYLCVFWSNMSTWFHDRYSNVGELLAVIFFTEDNLLDTEWNDQWNPVTFGSAVAGGG